MPVGEFEYGKALIPVYHSLYTRAEALMKRFNPCNVCDGVCERHRRDEGKNFCCEGCIYLGPEGCSVKALQCSLWICRYDLIAPVNKRAFDSIMWGLMIEASGFHLLYPRGSMEDAIARACRYYIEHRDEREALMKAALEYKPKPIFFAPPKASSKVMKEAFPSVHRYHTGVMDSTKPASRLKEAIGYYLPKKTAPAKEEVGNLPQAEKSAALLADTTHPGPLHEYEKEFKLKLKPLCAECVPECPTDKTCAVLPAEQPKMKEPFFKWPEDGCGCG